MPSRDGHECLQAKCDVLASHQVIQGKLEPLYAAVQIFSPTIIMVKSGSRYNYVS